MENGSKPRKESIEMRERGRSASPPREKRKPLNRMAFTPLRDPGTEVHIVPPTPTHRTNLSRTHSILAKCEEFVGIADSEEEKQELSEWSNKRLKFMMNKNYALSKKFAQSIESNLPSSSTPRTPIPAESLDVVRGRAPPLGRVPPQRESAFRILYSFITKGRITPSTSSLRRARSLAGQYSFMIGDSPLSSAISPLPLPSISASAGSGRSTEGERVPPIREHPLAEVIEEDELDVTDEGGKEEAAVGVVREKRCSSPTHVHPLLDRPTHLPMAGLSRDGDDVIENEVFFDIADESPSNVVPYSRVAAPFPLGGRSVVAPSLVPSRPPLPHAKAEFAKYQNNVRGGGDGIGGRIIGGKRKSLGVPDRLEDTLNRTVNERPIFTCWVCVVQSIVCLLCLLMYFGDPGPISFSRSKKEGAVRSLDDTIITVGVYEKGNIFIGPRFADLIRMGANYSPCMRAERKIMERIQHDTLKEAYTGCCVHTDEAQSCYQASRDMCHNAFATLYRFRHHRPTGSSASVPSEIVCGVDPENCEWPPPSSFEQNNITQWPMCEKKRPVSRLVHKPHLTCSIQGRPCCIHMQGQCRITTREYCDFVDGYFHENATLCSQVNCLDEVCGMLPFMNGKTPDQFYRIFFSLFLHAGLLHLLVTLVLQVVFMRDLELYIGWVRMCIIYLLGGIGGNLGSALFVPFNPEVGPSGALSAVVVALFVDVFCNRDKFADLYRVFAGISLWALLLLFIGLFPWVDNFAVLFGMIFGFFAAMIVIPDVGLSLGKNPRQGKRFRKIIVTSSSLILFSLLALLFYIFFSGIEIECSWCGKFNCMDPLFHFLADQLNIPDWHHFCDNQGLTLESWLPI